MGSTSGTFKNRYSNHKASFNNRLKRHSIELSNYKWELKDANKDYNLKLKILCRTKTKPKITKHEIYVAWKNEKYEIKKKTSLNKRKKTATYF